MIVELRQSLLSTDFQDTPGIVFDALSTAKESVSNIHISTIKNKACSSFRSLLEFLS